MGLLLAHRLLDAGCTVKIFEGRADPRSMMRWRAARMR